MLLVLAIFQIILFYDTNRDNLYTEREKTAPRESAISRIKRGVIISAPNSSLDHNDDGGYTSNDAHRGQLKRPVYWLNHTQIYRDDYFSGSWLAPIDILHSLEFERMRTLEDASNRLYRQYEKLVRMPVDWLDFAVEHMSRWWKHMDAINANKNDIAINRITGNLKKYVQDTPKRTKALLSDASTAPLLHPTIAIISSSSLVNENSNVTKQRSTDLTITTLGATIASLLRAGVGRIVCTGINDADEISVKETFGWLAEQYRDKGNWIAQTEFAYVRIEEELYKAPLKDINRPVGTVHGLQKALAGDFNESYTTQWLGTAQEPSYWRYVYFTEPDLVLQTRSASLPDIHKALVQGRVIFSHRLEAVQHESDLTEGDVVSDGSKSMLPREISQILDLDGDDDMCCDGGNNGSNRTAWTKYIKDDDPTGPKCITWWWMCGFTREWQSQGISEHIKHRRILEFAPFIRLKQGINIVDIPGSDHARRCHPRKRQTTNDICERPSPSGRSYATSEKRDKE